MALAAAPKPGENRKQIRAAFALTEPLPFVGVETALLSGKVRIAQWADGCEPVLQVEKRGRFITNMGFANVVTAAVNSDDPRIKGSCMVILEETDPGAFDRGLPTRKLVHQLSSTRDPVLNLRVPASRIVGGYTVKDGVLIPRYSHAEIIEAVFSRTRVTVGLMTAAKLLSSVAPVIMYQRRRFRGGEGAPGTPRYELGLQQKEDVLQRLVEVWAAGEASAALGFAAARIFDQLEPLEKKKTGSWPERTSPAARHSRPWPRSSRRESSGCGSLKPKDQRDETRLKALEANPWSASPCSMRRPTCFVPPASSGTPAMGPT